MISQQEEAEIDFIYSNYLEKKIVYSKVVSEIIGLVQRDTSIRVGDLVISCALISSTMESFVVLAKLDENMKRTIYDQNGSMIVQLKFLSKEGKNVLFTIHTNFLNLNSQGLNQEDLYFVAMKIRRKIPVDLILIFGQYHKNEAIRLINKTKIVECLLIVAEHKIDCITMNINKSELIVHLEQTETRALNQKAMAILKIVNTGEVIEILGTITGKDDETDKSCQLHLTYSMEDQSPRFGYSIHVLKNLINSQ